MDQTPRTDQTHQHHGPDGATAGRSPSGGGLWARLTERTDDERGDVPGWVLVTVMTAGIVGVLYGFAKDELLAILTQALSSVAP